MTDVEVVSAAQIKAEQVSARRRRCTRLAAWQRAGLKKTGMFVVLNKP